MSSETDPCAPVADPAPDDPAVRAPRPGTDRDRSAAGRRAVLQPAAVLTAWALFLLLVWLLGQHKDASTDEHLALGAMPLFGRWETHFGTHLLVPAATGALVIAVLPAIAARWRWRWTALATAAATAAFSLALAYAHSHPGTWEDMHRNYGQAIHFIDDAGGVGPFLASYV